MTRCTSRTGGYVAAIAAIAAATTFAPSAAADDRDKAMAEALFRAAKDLQAHGRNADACPKYAESHRLDPKPGTVLNLATCHETDGKTASAWADYSEAATLAARSRQPDRERFARSKADELEKKLAYVTFRFPASLEIAVDGKPLSSAAAGTRVPIDPGEHTIEAHAPGKTSWSSKFVVDAGPSERAVEVPPLADEKAAAVVAPIAAAPLVPLAAAPPQPSDPPPEAASSGGTQRTVGWIVAGVGVAGLAVGGIFGVKTLGEKSTVDGNCTGGFCNADGLAANDRAKSAATLSTVFVIAGGALVVGGIALVFTAPHATRTSPTTQATPAARLTVSPAGAAMAGSW